MCVAISICQGDTACPFSKLFLSSARARVCACLSPPQGTKNQKCCCSTREPRTTPSLFLCHNLFHAQQYKHSAAHHHSCEALHFCETRSFHGLKKNYCESCNLKPYRGVQFDWCVQVFGAMRPNAFLSLIANFPRCA